MLSDKVWFIVSNGKTVLAAYRLPTMMMNRSVSSDEIGARVQPRRIPFKTTQDVNGPGHRRHPKRKPRAIVSDEWTRKRKLDVPAPSPDNSERRTAMSPEKHRTVLRGTTTGRSRIQVPRRVLLCQVEVNLRRGRLQLNSPIYIRRVLGSHTYLSLGLGRTPTQGSECRVSCGGVLVQRRIVCSAEITSLSGSAAKHWLHHKPLGHERSGDTQGRQEGYALSLWRIVGTWFVSTNK